MLSTFIVKVQSQSLLSDLIDTHITVKKQDILYLPTDNYLLTDKGFMLKTKHFTREDILIFYCWKLYGYCR